MEGGLSEEVLLDLCKAPCKCLPGPNRRPCEPCAKLATAARAGIPTLSMERLMFEIMVSNRNATIADFEAGAESKIIERQRKLIERLHWYVRHLPDCAVTAWGVTAEEERSAEAPDCTCRLLDLVKEVR